MLFFVYSLSYLYNGVVRKDRIWTDINVLEIFWDCLASHWEASWGLETSGSA